MLHRFIAEFIIKEKQNNFKKEILTPVPTVVALAGTAVAVQENRVMLI